MGNELHNLRFSNGSYEGETSGGKMNGEGTFYFNSGNKYEGEWKDDEKHGQGTYFDVNGDRYEGEWENDEKNGKGTFYYRNGNRYEGEFKDDQRHGEGVLYYKSGNRYEGTWKNDRREGSGVHYFSNGRREDQEYVRGVKSSTSRPSRRSNIDTSRRKERKKPKKKVVSRNKTKRRSTSTSSSTNTTSRYAFLVGQNEGELTCCVNDATKMSQTLENNFGYECTLKTNIKMKEFELSFRSFIEEIEDDPSSTYKRIFFYFSGHGYEEDGKLYLKCIGRKSIKLEKILRSLNKIKTRELHVTTIIDACRIEERKGKLSRFLKKVSLTPPQVSNFEKSFILGFSCGSGRISYASNSKGNSLYTSELLSSMISMGKKKTIMEILTRAGDRLNEFRKKSHSGKKKYDSQQAWVNLTAKEVTLKMKL